MNITLNPINWTGFKGKTVTLITAKATFVGTLISLNSKGWNIKEDITGRLITRTDSVVSEIFYTEATLTDADYSEMDDTDEDFEDIDLNFEEIDLDMPGEVDNDEDFEEGDSTRDVPAQTITGQTTADLAAMFGTSARALRVQLRKLGLGVGQGRQYNLTDNDIEKVRTALKG